MLTSKPFLIPSLRQALSAMGLTLLGLMAAPHTAWADIVVIVHPSNTAAIDDDAISKLFLGQLKTFPGGAAATPVDQKSAEASGEFHTKVLNTSSKEVRKIWARQVFTGGLRPPTALDGDEAVVQFVSTTPDAIGYVQAAKVTNKVKVIRK
jgi:ABC-type phosphate transport system substrate-binding protein